MSDWRYRMGWGSAAAVAILGVSLAAVAAAEPGAAESPQVSLVIDYGDGVEKHFTALAWKDGMTVLDAMQAARQHPRGIAIETRGGGPRTMLTRIDDLANEGSGRNWIYRVNGKLADRGIGAFNLKLGDTVLWRFEKYR